MITAIVTTVVGALLVAGAFAIIKSRWLYVVAPKLYMNTPLSDGQIVSITLTNQGLLDEEDVAVTFRRAANFELVGTSKSTLVVSGKTLSVPKLSRFEVVSVILLFEGKAFDPVDIESVESKNTKGKVVEAKEKATGVWQAVIAIPVALGVLALPFFFGTLFGAETGVSAFGYVKEQVSSFREESKQLAGYESTLREVSYSKSFDKSSQRKKVRVEPEEVIRRGDVITIKTRISNETDEVLTVEGYLKSSAGERGTVDFWDTRVESFALGPNESQVVTQKAFLPDTTKIKLVDNRFSFETMDGESVTVVRSLRF